MRHNSATHGNGSKSALFLIESRCSCTSSRWLAAGCKSRQLTPHDRRRYPRSRWTLSTITTSCGPTIRQHLQRSRCRPLFAYLRTGAAHFSLRLSRTSDSRRSLRCANPRKSPAVHAEGFKQVTGRGNAFIHFHDSEALWAGLFRIEIRRLKEETW